MRKLRDGGALSLAGLCFADTACERRYRAHATEDGRRFNRISLPVLLVIFDLFILPEFRAAPDLIRISALLRFCVLTPACLLYLWLDMRDQLGRCYAIATTALLVAPTLFASIEAASTISQSILPNTQAIPLILLSALVARQDIRHTLAFCALSCAIYVPAICSSEAVPKIFLASMIMTDLGIGAAVAVFAIRVELRERRVFWLVEQAEATQAALAEQNIDLRETNYTDALTGCANRRAFDERFAASWEEGCRSSQPLGLILVDVDHFKSYNDHYGHRAGDECLWLVASTAMGEVAKGDLFARYGGEEFALIMPGARAWRVEEVAQAVRRAIVGMRLAHEGVGADAVVTVSVGTASVIPDAQTDRHRLFEAADRCLYAAKRGGRNRVVSHAQLETAQPHLG